MSNARNFRVERQHKKLLEEVANELRFFKTVRGCISSAYEKIEDTNMKLTKHIETKCAKEYNWIMDNKGKMDSEYSQVVNEFQSCYNQNDFGLSGLTREIWKAQAEQKDNSMNCIVTCKSVGGKEQVKECLKGCLLDTMGRYQKSFAIINEKFDEINNKIIL